MHYRKRLLEIKNQLFCNRRLYVKQCELYRFYIFDNTEFEATVGGGYVRNFPENSGKFPAHFRAVRKLKTLDLRYWVLIYK